MARHMHTCVRTVSRRAAKVASVKPADGERGMHFNETLGEVDSPTAASREAHKEILEMAIEVPVGCTGEV